MDPIYVIESNWQFKTSDIKELPVICKAAEKTLAETLSEEDIISIVSDTVYLKITFGPEENGYRKIEWEDSELYMTDEVQEFFIKVAPFSKGGVSFDTGLASENFRYTFVKGELVRTNIFPTEQIYVLFDEDTDSFCGTVTEAYKEALKEQGNYTFVPIEQTFVYPFIAPEKELVDEITNN